MRASPHRLHCIFAPPARCGELARVFGRVITLHLRSLFCKQNIITLLPDFRCSST